MTTVTWEITSINATPDFACVSYEGYTIFPQYQQVWDPNQDYTSQDGSKVPVTFRTPVSLQNYIVAMNVTGTCGYPQSWRGQSYIIGAWLGDTQVLQSGVVPVPTGNSVNVTNFFLISPNPDSAAVIPFRWSGDFVWGISLASTPPGPSYAAATATRLELCWSRAAAPDGPSVPTPARQNTRVDLRPGYPIALFRWFSPNPTEFLNVTQNDILNFYIARAMIKIWTWPDANFSPRYDVAEGRSKYGVGGLGGSFSLVDWMNKKFPTLNCYDLAGISQLACAILVNQNGDEIVDSHWVLQFPNGYVNPGPLYGWNRVNDGRNHMACNNPFWAAGGKNNPNPDAPRFDPPTSPWIRSSFGNHAWAEVVPRPGVPQVLDACHASTLYPYPDAGTRSRVDYITGTLDGQREPRGNAINKQGETGTGSCCLNPDYRLERVGVYDANGQSNAGHFASLVPMLPEPLRADLEETMERGKSSQPSDACFNTAPVHPDTLILLLSSEPGLRHQETHISVRRNATRLNLGFKNSEPCNLETVDLTLDIFDSFEKAISALTSHLLTFQARPLQSVIKPLETQLGDFSYRTPSSVFWVRGNQFIHVQEIKADPVAPSGSSAIYQIAAKLDEHLASNISRVDVGAPSVFLDDRSLQSHVLSGQSFSTRLQENAALLKTKQAFCDDTSILLPSGPVSDGVDLRFFALKSGTTQVHICVADAVTLRPGEVTFEVEVESNPDAAEEGSGQDTGVRMEFIDMGATGPPVAA